MNGQCPGSTAKAAINQQRGFIRNGEPYSKDFGNWHFAFLSSAHWRYNPSQARALTTWLDNDLAAAKAAGKHLAVVHHEPYFTSNTREHDRASDHKPWIDVMWKHRVRLTLSGSQHNYERSCPVNNADQCVSDGMTAFQVSTGGIDLRPFTSSPSYIVKRFSDTHGFLPDDTPRQRVFRLELRSHVGVGHRHRHAFRTVVKATAKPSQTQGHHTKRPGGHRPHRRSYHSVGRQCRSSLLFPGADVVSGCACWIRRKSSRTCTGWTWQTAGAPGLKSTCSKTRTAKCSTRMRWTDSIATSNSTRRTHHTPPSISRVSGRLAWAVQIPPSEQDSP